MFAKNARPATATRMSTPLRKVTRDEYILMPERYELRSGHEKGAPLCPYGNHFEWVGYDMEVKEYVRFTKAVFIKLRRKIEPLEED